LGCIWIVVDDSDGVDGSVDERVTTTPTVIATAAAMPPIRSRRGSARGRTETRETDVIGRFTLTLAYGSAPTGDGVCARMDGGVIRCASIEDDTRATWSDGGVTRAMGPVGRGGSKPDG